MASHFRTAATEIISVTKDICRNKQLVGDAKAVMAGDSQGSAEYGIEKCIRHVFYEDVC